MNHLFEEIASQLRIVDISRLHNHEDIIPPNLIRLKEAMLNIGQLVDPLIVDKKSMVILDGNHRIKVLELIKCPRAVCQMVDYESPKIQVGTWFPLAEKLSAEELKAAGCKLETVELEAGLRALEGKKAAFMLARKENGTRKYLLVNPADYSLEEMMVEQKRIVEKLARTEFYYYGDDEAENQVDKGRSVLYRKIYTKDEIVARARAGKLFPPKSTRHLIPNRIIRLNMRLGWLHEGEKEASEYLERTLRERIYNGNVRRYSEPVIVIY